MNQIRDVNRDGMLSRIAKELSTDRTKAVLVHGNADMDALGSAYAIARCFPGCAIFAPDGLDRVSKMVAAKTETAVRDGLGEGFEMIVVVDTSSPEQLRPDGGIHADIVMDHHKPTGRWDADLFYCDDTRSSCCEIVKELIETAGIDIPRDVALMLMGGMLTDSGHFQFANAGLLRSFSELMDMHGIAMDEAMGFVQAGVSISERIAMLKAVSRVRVERVGQMIVAVSAAGSFEASSCRAILASGADVAFVGSQRDDEFRISGRATQEAVRKGIHLGEIMGRVGGETLSDGGGHGAAAGLNGIGDVEAMLTICMENTMDAMRRIREKEDAERLANLRSARSASRTHLLFGDPSAFLLYGFQPLSELAFQIICGLLARHQSGV